MQGVGRIESPDGVLVLVDICGILRYACLHNLPLILKLDVPAPVSRAHPSNEIDASKQLFWIWPVS
jgi:hypothetical protein